MASTDISTSSTPAADKRTVDEAFLNRLKNLVERLRLENATLKKSLETERSGLRGLKALHEAAIRNLKTEHKKKEEILEKQLRIPSKTEKSEDGNNNRLADCKRLTVEIQSLKAANKGLQEKVKVAQAAECARAAELRAQAAKHAALENAARKDARAQCHKLLEEIKSKERVIMQLKREATRGAQDNAQAPRMEYGAGELSRKLRVDQTKENSDREDLKTDIQHRKETFYREAPSADSAVSSAPASLSPQPLTDMWSCGQCRAAQERAATAARECARLGDQLRDARDQLELMEFRLLELDALPDKARDNLTDSDSGCVSPGSRIKDSASPELKRMDSGYKSPAPSSPHPRRHLATPHDDFKEDFAKAQVLADILDRTSESSDSLRSNPVKEHLEQMILNAGSVEDRNCLEQVLMLLYNLQALSSSVSEDECYQIKPKRICDLKTKPETDITSQKIQKAIATVTPYQQKGYKCESFESLCGDERKPSNVLQESGIFEGVETETRSTQTDVNDSFECSGELNTEIQRLNSIREKLERQGVRNRTLNSKEEGDSLECRCVKLGKKHKQYYERRLKFLEGKISIYEAAQDVKEAKLAQRLQTEFILENRIQELELQLSELQDKYERLEEECCELEEIENDTRLHWQQLEMDYELCSAQLRDMTEQRECSRAQAERLMAELNRNECALKHKQEELRTRLNKLEKAVPALIAWNVINAIGAYVSPAKERMLSNRIGPFGKDARAVVDQVRKEKCSAVVALSHAQYDDLPGIGDMQNMIAKLVKEKRELEEQTTKVTSSLKEKVRQLQEELDITKMQIRAAECRCGNKRERIEEQISGLKRKIDGESMKEELPVDPAMMSKIHALIEAEKELKARVAELERRETAYLEMLTQADDMWAEMEGGYKKKIQEAHAAESCLKGQVRLQLKARVAELERRETAYLEMLTQADDMWAEMEGGYKKKIQEAHAAESCLKGQVRLQLKARVAELERRETAYLEMLTQADDMWAEMEGGYKKKIQEAYAAESCLKGQVRLQLKARVAELERRETAYLEMLTQADDMWAEMEGGYKKKIQEAHAAESCLKGQVRLQLKARVAELERRETAYLEMLTQADDMWAEMEGGYKKKIQEAYAAESCLKGQVRLQLKARVAELERRETAYLKMLTQADDMWAEMEGGYKKKIQEAHAAESCLKGQVKKLQDEKDQYKKTIDPLKKTLRELEEADSLLKIALEKTERDSHKQKCLNQNLQSSLAKTELDLKKSEAAFKSLEVTFKRDVEQLRKLNKEFEKESKLAKEAARKSEHNFHVELEAIRKELQRSCKNHQDLEVTNGELKEEVESLEKQLALTQKALTQCKRKCDEKIKTLSHELSIKTEELEELRSETMRQSFHASRIELKPDRSEYVDEGYSIYTAVPKKTDYDRMHHSMSYITSDSRCSCPAMRSQLVGQLIEDLFDRIHNTVDDDLNRVCKEIKITGREMSAETKAKITNYLLMAISKELVRSIGDADAKTDTEEWQRAASTMPLPYRDAAGRRLEGNAGVLQGAARLASVSCACAAARLAAALPDIADGVKVCQEEVLDHGDVKIMEEQLANAIESIVNCPSCALGTNAIVWSTDV